MISLGSHKTVHASVRPARVAILVDRADQDWQHTCLRIIEFYSQLWGGAYNIIVPTDGAQISEPFWTLLEKFDPDHIYRYHKSGEDVFLSQPDRYQEMLEGQVEAFAAQSHSSNRDTIRTQIDKELRRAWVPSQFEIAPALHKEIKTRLAPFWFEQWVVNAGAITAGSAASFQLTNITKIISYTEHPGRIALIDAPMDLLPTLWFSAMTGRLNSAAMRAFEQVEVTPEPFPFRDDNVDQLIEFTITGAMRGRRVSSPSTTLLDLGSAAPFNISMLQLGLYRSIRYQAWQEPMLAVAGNTFEDFCLFYCLSRLRDGVVWVLPSITEKALAANADAVTSVSELSFLFQLRNAESSSQSEGGLGCITYSLTSIQVDSVIGQLDRHGAGRFRNQIKKIDDVEPLIRFPLTAIERDSLQRDITLQFADDRSISPFSTPKPKHFDPIHPFEHRYITQLSVVGEAPPKHFHLGSYSIAAPQYTTGEVRVGKDGPAYLCPNVAYFGGDIDTVLVRPRLHLPPLHKIVEELARTQGYECRPSDKGIYADESISKWGGLEKISTFLRNTSHRALLDQFRDISKSESGKGVHLADKRRYLDFTAIRACVSDEAVPLIDDLISKQILYRGFVFGCSYCRNVDWFSVGDITQEFTCRRCGQIQVYAKRSWRQGDEPAWFYKLDELIYQGYRQGMAVSLLALNYLRAQSQESFTFATDREFWRPEALKPDVEADFFCVPDGVLTVGEAKTENSLGRGTNEENIKISKYKRLVTGLSIRQLVFATMSSGWRGETVDAVRSAFGDLQHVRIVFLDASQLL
jgi:hypothetical protein